MKTLRFLFRAIVIESLAIGLILLLFVDQAERRELPSRRPRAARLQVHRPAPAVVRVCVPVGR